MDLDLARISDPCRVIVESLIDYGGNKDEKTANRQYAARDARALSYIVRKGMDPLEVAKPANGETLTKWADREAAYRLGQRPAAKRAQKGPAAAVLAPEAPNQLPVVQVAQPLYNALAALLEPGLVVVRPQGRGKSLGLSRGPAEVPNRRPSQSSTGQGSTGYSQGAEKSGQEDARKAVQGNRLKEGRRAVRRSARQVAPLTSPQREW